MTLLAWVLSALLALVFLAAGGSKLLTPREKLLANPRMGWAGSVSDRQVKAIGAVEVLGALGVVLPWWTGVARVLTPVAAVGLALVMVGAARTHARRGEPQAYPVVGVLLLLALVVAVIRFTQL